MKCGWHEDEILVEYDILPFHSYSSYISGFKMKSVQHLCKVTFSPNLQSQQGGGNGMEWNDMLGLSASVLAGRAARFPLLFPEGDLNFLVHISSSWVEISLYTEFQLPRLSGSRIASFRLNPICFISFFCVCGGGQVT